MLKEMHWEQVLSLVPELICGFFFRVNLEGRSSRSLVSIQLQSTGCRVPTEWATFWGHVLCSGSLRWCSGTHLCSGIRGKALAGCRSMSLRVLLP